MQTVTLLPGQIAFKQPRVLLRVTVLLEKKQMGWNAAAKCCGSHVG